MIRKILSKIETIVNDNWLNPLLTIYINFCCLPLRQAIKLPIFVYGRPKLFVANGKIILPTMCKTGMVKFNISRPGVDGNDSQSELRLCGNITFHGKAVIVQSNKLDVFGNLEIGQNMLMQEHCLIGCYISIKVGNSFCMAHRSQMMDSNLHWMADMASRVVKRFSSPIIMGDYCWLCTNTLVLGETVRELQRS